MLYPERLVQCALVENGQIRGGRFIGSRESQVAAQYLIVEIKAHRILSRTDFWHVTIGLIVDEIVEPCETINVEGNGTISLRPLTEGREPKEPIVFASQGFVLQD